LIQLIYSTRESIFLFSVIFLTKLQKKNLIHFSNKRIAFIGKFCTESRNEPHFFSLFAHVHNLLQIPSVLTQRTLNNSENNQNMCTVQQQGNPQIAGRLPRPSCLGYQYHLFSIKNTMITFGKHDRAQVEPLVLNRTCHRVTNVIWTEDENSEILHS
jgi:hypothetical protein